MALTVRQVETKSPGKYSDGSGLQLVVTATGARRWVLRYRLNQKSSEMGLGSASAGGVTLAEAREAAREAQKLAKRKTCGAMEQHDRKILRSHQRPSP